MEFPCSKCGACCRRAGLIPDFPEPVHKDNSCTHLLDDNSCAIYEDRPDICSVDKVRKYFPFLTEKEYVNATIQVCNEMIDADGLDQSYKIKPIEKAT